MPHIGKVIIINICFLLFFSFGIAFSGDYRISTTTTTLFNKLFITNTQSLNKPIQESPIIREDLSGSQILDKLLKTIEVGNFEKG